MKESEPNSKTQNKLKSISDQTHGKNEPILHEQSAGYKRNKKKMVGIKAKSMRPIHI